MISLLRFALLAAFVSLTAASFRQLSSANQESESSLPKAHEVLYLPEGRGLEFLSFGFKNTLADILWFNAISYFGKHYRLDQDYTWLGHMCSLITTLDSRARHVFEFCSLMLAWEAGLADQAVSILDKAIGADPEFWRYFYLRGITYAFFFKNDKRARDDFLSGSKLPNAPPFMARLAGKKMALDDPQNAIEFLKEMIAAATEESQRQALTRHLEKIELEQSLKNRHNLCKEP